MVETPLSPWQFTVVIALIGLLIGLSNGGLGGGLGIIVTPLMILAVPNVPVALALILPMLVVGDAFALATYWGQWDGALVRRLLPGALVGLAVGLLVLISVPARTMRLALGIFSLLVIVYKIAGDSIRNLRYQPRPWHAAAVGVLSGTASTLFNAGGPPFTAYLILNGVPPRPFIATGAIFFAILNITKLPGFLVAGVATPAQLVSVWWGYLFIPLGNWLGRRLIDRIDPKLFEWVVMGMVLLAAGLLIWQSI